MTAIQSACKRIRGNFDTGNSAALRKRIVIWHRSNRTDQARLTSTRPGRFTRTDKIRRPAKRKLPVVLPCRRPSRLRRPGKSVWSIRTEFISPALDGAKSPAPEN